MFSNLRPRNGKWVRFKADLSIFGPQIVWDAFRTPDGFYTGIYYRAGYVTDPGCNSPDGQRWVPERIHLVSRILGEGLPVIRGDGVTCNLCLELHEVSDLHILEDINRHTPEKRRDTMRRGFIPKVYS